MTLWLPEYKRDHIVNLLDTWTASPRFSFTILQAAELNGLLIDASRCCRWGRAFFIVLQNTLRTLLQQRYAQYQGYKDRATKRAYSLISSNTDMPNSVAKKLAGLVGTRDFATQMWRSSITTTISPYLRQELSELCEYLRNPDSLWQINIGHIIERDHIAEFFGDASHYGCGFYCTQIQTICMLPLSSGIRRRLKLNDAHDEYLHINCIEYLTALLEYACAVTVLEDTNMEPMRNTFFPDGVPSMPVIRSRLDNTSSVSWIRKVASSSIQAQQLIKIYAQILHHSDVETAPYTSAATSIYAPIDGLAQTSHSIALTRLHCYLISTRPSICSLSNSITITLCQALTFWVRFVGDSAPDALSIRSWARFQCLPDPLGLSCHYMSSAYQFNSFKKVTKKGFRYW
jgi:hypothetical protein